MGVINDPYAQQMLPANLGWRPLVSVLRLLGLGYDEFVTRALESGIRQVVVLGAGYDSRAWRFARPGVRFFEGDLLTTQADKRLRSPSAGPVYVSADVTDRSFTDKLTSAGFSPGQATAFTVEGLTMYLTAEHVGQLLRSLAELGGPRSRLAVNFGVGFEREDSRRGRFGRRAMAYSGEGFRFRLPLADAPEFLTKAGWTVEEVLTGQQLRDKYLSATRLAAVNVTTTEFAVAAVISE
jgi:methyltransferase (TIGR00027 family)